jgi:fumarate hydratase class II
MVAQLGDITGLPLKSSDDLFESMQSMADAADFSAALRTLALTLTRISNDIRLMASGPGSGLNEIRLPAVQPGSSIMPGKVNPVMAEMVNMAMFHIIGCDTTVAFAAQAGQLELNVMMPVIAHNLFEMMQVMIGALRSFTERCVRGIEANPEMAAFWLERNAIIITALNPIIGYKAGAEIVQIAIAEGRSVREIAERMARNGDLRHQSEDRGISPEEVRVALDDLFGLTEGGIVDRQG